MLVNIKIFFFHIIILLFLIYSDDPILFFVSNNYAFFAPGMSIEITLNGSDRTGSSLFISHLSLSTKKIKNLELSRAKVLNDN